MGGGLLPVTSAVGMKQSTTRIPRSMVLMVGPLPCPHPLQALPRLPGPHSTSLPSLWGQGAPLRCWRNFSPPPSAAHDTLPSETTVMAMLEQEVQLFYDFSPRNLPLKSLIMLKRCWKPAFQDMFGALQGCSCQDGMDFPRDAVVFIYQESVPMYTRCILMGDTNTSFQVPGGQTWPLRKLCAQKPSSFLTPRSRNLPLLACHVASACFPSPWEHWHILAVVCSYSFLSMCFLPECRVNSAGNSDLVYLHILKNIPNYEWVQL